MLHQEVDRSAAATAAAASFPHLAGQGGGQLHQHLLQHQVVVRVALQRVGLMVVGSVHDGWLDGSGDGGMAGKQIAGLIWWMQRWLAQWPLG